MIGAGNVATHLGLALKESGINVMQIFSRSVGSARTLANLLQANFTTNIVDVKSDADLYIVSLADQAVKNVVDKLNINDALIVHTSGSLSMQILDEVSVNVGVIYPFQTFSKSKKLEFMTIPICIEANTFENREKLSRLTGKISNNIIEINSEKRKYLHLAGVFASNFPNFMYSMAEDILAKNELPFDLLKPLIRETAAKIKGLSPAEAQTGPARRGDDQIIKNHIELLDQFQGFENIYRMISDMIKKKQHE